MWFPAGDEAAPLVMFLHGYGASPEHSARVLELAALAKRTNVHIAAPEGTPDESGLRFWHANAACCDFDRSGIDDVATLNRVLDDIDARHAVTQHYLVGFSNGAFMAHRLACDASERIDGFVAFAGVGDEDTSRCKPKRPLTMLQIHGTADRGVRYRGGYVLGKKEMARHPGAEETVAFWAKHNACGEPTHPPPPHDISNHPTTVVQHACAKETRVALWTVNGGGHLVGIDPVTMEAAIRFLLASR